MNKRPPPGEFRTNSRYKPLRTAEVPSRDVTQQGAACLATLPEMPLYARVDGVVRDGTLIVIEVEVLDFGKSSPADMDRVEAALRADTGHTIKAVLTTHVDTASTIKTDIPSLRAAMDAARHPALARHPGTRAAPSNRHQLAGHRGLAGATPRRGGGLAHDLRRGAGAAR